jgi:hypothetical protein
MITVTISENIAGRLETSKHEFKSHRDAFGAVQTFWRNHSDKKFPADNLVGTKWHFEPSSSVTMDVEFASEELKKHKFYVLCDQDDLSQKLCNPKTGKFDKASLRLVEDERSPIPAVLEFAYSKKQDHHELRYNPRFGETDYRIHQALCKAELCYSQKHQQVASVYITDDFKEPKCGLNSPEWPSLTQEERFIIEFCTSVFNQSLDILVSDFDVHMHAHIVPDMKKVLLADAEVFSNVKGLEILPEFLRTRKRILNLATVLNIDRKCGTSFTTRMDASKADLRGAETICSLCSMETIPKLGYCGFPPGYVVGMEVFKFLGFDRYVTLAWDPIW